MKFTIGEPIKISAAESQCSIGVDNPYLSIYQKLQELQPGFTLPVKLDGAKMSGKFLARYLNKLAKKDGQIVRQRHSKDGWTCFYYLEAREAAK